MGDLIPDSALPLTTWYMTLSLALLFGSQDYYLENEGLTSLPCTAGIL